jgi:hypothetical protein
MFERRGAKGSAAWTVASAGGWFAGVLAALFALEHIPRGSGNDAVRSALARQHDEVATDQRIAPDPESAGLSRAELEDLVTNAPNLRGMFADGHHEWLETLVLMDDYGFVAEARLGCAARHAREIDSCTFRLVTVVQPLEGEVGRVLHARAELVDPAESPTPRARNHPDCKAYVDCLADIRVEETLPIPPDRPDVFAFEELYGSSQVGPELLRADKVREMLPMLEQEIALFEAKEDRTMPEEHKLRKVRNMARHLRKHLHRLEELSP